MNYTYANIDVDGQVNFQTSEFGDDNHPLNGSSLQEYIDVTYGDLVRTFQQPNMPGDHYKVDAEWFIMTPAGAASIYNYKDGKNYCGKEGTPKTKIRDWHIGGKSKEVVKYIMQALRVNPKIKKARKEVKLEITDEDREELGKQISEGYVQGRLDCDDGKHITWSLDTEVWKD